MSIGKTMSLHKQDGTEQPERKNQPGSSVVNAAGQNSQKQEEEMQALRAEQTALMERLARQQAEFENARKRSVKAQAEYREYALADVAKSLLPVLDNLERALEHKTEAKDFSSGVELIYRQLQDTLNKIGVKPIAAEGEQFNPEWHEAVETAESDSQQNRVLNELQRGYTFKGRLLRPAMVRVSRHK
jgi:molecular chaperone GrpE